MGQFPIRKFVATKVFGERKYEIEFRGGQPVSIVVGPNGTGKSTLLSLYYLSITKQWGRLSEYDFESLHIFPAVGNGIRIDASDIIRSSEQLFLPPSLRRYYQKVLSSGTMSQLTLNSSSTILRRLSREINVPEVALRDLRDLIAHEPTLFHPNLEIIESSIDSLEIGHVMYLPTFRRIEKDININVKIDDTVKRRPEKNDYTELVKSGMQDVTDMMRRYISDLNAQSRSRVTNAFQEFISDMVRGKISEYSLANIKKYDSVALQAFIMSLQDELFTNSDKERLVQFVEKEQLRKQGKPKKDDQYMGYFVNKMLEIFTEMQELESPIRNFIGIVDGYLGKNKEIYQDASEVAVVNVNSKSILPLEALSSGEKQIISLFSYLLLSEVKSFIVLIDEPELSLSVPWQRSFIPDIMKTGRCSQLFSVTHSPFIFDNNYFDDVVDIDSLYNND